MSPLAISCVIFGCIAAAGVLGMMIARVLPEHHGHQDSKESVKQGLALITTLAALVLALLVAGAKGTYDAQRSAVRQLAADLLLLDRLLALYGPDTREARELLRRAADATLERMWPDDNSQPADLTPGEARADFETFHHKVTALAPELETQRALRARALDVAASLAQTRFRLFAQRDSSIPVPLLVVLVFWLVILFGGWGLLAARNATVVVILLVCALSVSCAVFLILELDRPFEGILRVSSAPLRDAISQLGK